MDITNIDINYIEIFWSAYVSAKFVFDVDPIEALPSKKKKIRKWVMKNHIDESELPKKVLSFIDKSRTDNEFVEFLFECHKYIVEHGTWKQQLFDKASNDFCEDVKKAFQSLLVTTLYSGNIKVEQGRITMTVDTSDIYERKIVLHTSHENPIGNYDAYHFNNGQLIKNDNGYRLICEGENQENKTVVPTNIFFDNATVDIKVYRADRGRFDESPWETLSLTAMRILEKENLGEEYFNEKERDLIHLLRDISGLLVWFPVGDGIYTNFTYLKKYVKKHDLNHILPLIEKVVSHSKNKSRALVTAVRRLNNKLNEACCEPLWREIYELICLSQEGYPDRSASYEMTEIYDARKRIENTLHGLGYEGVYPDFRKKGSLKGLKVVSSYDQSYFVAREKDVEYFIKCIEEFNEEIFNVQFLCGTAFLKRNEVAKDVYSCCFNVKGRRLFKTMTMYDDDIFSADEFARVAAKKAECEKLTKKERDVSHTFDPSWKFFYAFVLVAGGLFGAFMTAGFFLITSLLTLLFVGFEGLTVILAVPWWKIFVFCLVSFGGLMGIFEIIVRLK